MVRGSVINELLISKALMELVGLGEFKASLMMAHVFFRFFELLSMAFEKCNFLTALKILL